MIFTNARLILPDGIRDGLEVVVEQGKIAAIRPTPSLRRTSEMVRGERQKRRGHKSHTLPTVMPSERIDQNQTERSPKGGIGPEFHKGSHVQGTPDLQLKKI